MVNDWGCQRPSPAIDVYEVLRSLSLKHEGVSRERGQEEGHMQAFVVTLGRTGGGSSTFKVIVHAATPDMARRAAIHQNPGYAAQAVRAA